MLQKIPDQWRYEAGSVNYVLSIETVSLVLHLIQQPQEQVVIPIQKIINPALHGL